MKNLILCLILCFSPLTAWSHPGKTDHYGGHKCLKGCEEWGLYYAEYHFHDKEGKPIHIKRKKHSTETPAVIESAITGTILTAPIITSKTQSVTVYRYVTTVQEENVFITNPLLWVLLVLLLLLFILRRDRKDRTI